MVLQKLYKEKVQYINNQFFLQFISMQVWELEFGIVPYQIGTNCWCYMRRRRSLPPCSWPVGFCWASTHTAVYGRDGVPPGAGTPVWASVACLPPPAPPRVSRLRIGGIGEGEGGRTERGQGRRWMASAATVERRGGVAGWRGSWDEWPPTE